MDFGFVENDLQQRRDAHRFRTRRVILPLDATHVSCNDRKLVQFCSNNYLGLTHHAGVREAARRAITEFGAGSGAAPLISGQSPVHASFEETLARWKGAEAAILLPSGYQANLAAVQTAAAIGAVHGGVRFLVDKLAHASLIDAIRGTGQPYRVFPHNHLPKLRRLLADAPAGLLQVVVTESIFSMDGDRADLRGLADLKQRHDFLLLLDEAHATGVYGPAGAGLAAELDLRDIVDISVLTLSKAMGGMGGAVCGSKLVCDELVNAARAYLFSTAIPPAIAAAGEAAIHVVHSEPERQQRVRHLARTVRQRLADSGMVIPDGDSPIIPIILGDEKSAMDAAEKLFEMGLLVMPVRPPTVPRGASRLRVTLCCEHVDADVDQLIDTLRQLPSA